jgi:hypothetical protein
MNVMFARTAAFPAGRNERDDMFVLRRGYGLPMDDQHRKDEPLEDGRPAEVREGQKPQTDREKEEDIPDPSTVESVGY